MTTRRLTRARPARQHGGSLLEVIAASGLAAIVTTTSMTTIARSAALLRHQHDLARMIDDARNAMERAIAEPCSPIVACAPGHTCAMERQPLAATEHYRLLRVKISVHRDAAEEPSVSVSTLVRAPPSC